MKLNTLILTTAMIFAINVHASDDTKQNANAKKDSAAMAWLIVVNKSEIEAAKTAKVKKMDTNVMEYADLMIEAHSKNLDETLNISKKIEIEPFEDSKTIALEKNSKKELSKMEKLDDKKFQQAYVDAMVKDHTDALKTLDEEYLPKVSNEELKEHLTQTRTHISEHLDKAKKLKMEENNKTK